MASVLKVLFEFLRTMRFARNCIKLFPRCAASLLASLGRKLNTCWRYWLGKPGSFGRPKPADRPSLGTERSSHSVSGDSAVLGEYVIASSSVPERTGRHPETSTQTAGVHPPLAVVANPSVVVVSHSVDHPLAANSSPLIGGTSLVDRNSLRGSADPPSGFNIQSRASDRFSSITDSAKSMRAPPGQQSRLFRDTHRQSGGGPDRSPGERGTDPHTPQHPSRFGIIATILPSSTHRDSRKPLTESLPISSSTNPQQITGQLSPIDTASVHPSPDSLSVDRRDAEPPRGFTTSSNHATLSHFVPEGRLVWLIDSEQIPRYEKDIKIPRMETTFHLRPLTTKFSHLPDLSDSESEQNSLLQDCGSWIPATHPDGSLYFYDQERRLFTDTYMHNSKMREEIEDFYDCLQRVIDIKKLSIPSNNYDLVLDIGVTDSEDRQISWSYYYACHEAQCLFWLETYDMISTNRTLGVKSPAHIKHRLEELYWNHWSLFPVVFGNRRVSPEVYDELMGTLTHGCIDVTTSKSSTLPYDEDTMRKWIQLVERAKESKGGLACYTAGITRLLSFFACWRFLDFHGQPHARIVTGQTVYDKPSHERTLLITILSPLLFLAPEGQLEEMDRWIDEVIIEPEWKSFIVQMLAEWEGVILWSTVMLSANVGFLAIPGVILSNLNSSLTSASQVVIFTSYSQIASSLSMEASIGSIIIGLLLIRVNRTRHKEEPADALTYLFRGTHGVFGLEPMAIYFSLPWALLMWSMVLFFIALLLLCFNISNVSTRVFVTIMSALVATLIGWCIRISWDLVENDKLWKKTLAVLQRIGGVLFENVTKLNPFPIRRGQLDRARV